MTPEHRRAIGEGQRRAWKDPSIARKRAAAIARAWDDPLRRALMAKAKTKPGSRRGSRGEYD
jgi:hypothetical protein